jgi:hypothetical protein
MKMTNFCNITPGKLLARNGKEVQLSTRHEDLLGKMPSLTHFVSLMDGEVLPVQAPANSPPPPLGIDNGTSSIQCRIETRDSAPIGCT